MKTELRSDKSYKFSITAFFIFTVLSFVGTLFMGELLLPVCSAFYAVLLLFERGKHMLSLICAFVGACTVFIPFTTPPMWPAASLICGFILYLLYRFGNTKCDTAFLMTLFIAVSLVVSFILIAFVRTGEYNLGSAVNFYTELYESLRGGFIESVSQIKLSLTEGTGEIEISKEYIAAAFDAVFKLLVSFLVIISFVLAGLTLKLFCAVVRRFADEDSEIYKWKFTVPSMYAYLYIALFLLSSFVYTDGIFGISVINLSGIFATVFAYVGLKAVFEMFSKKNRSFIGVIIIVLAFVFLGNLAVDVVSVFGVFHTIKQNKLSVF